MTLKKIWVMIMLVVTLGFLLYTAFGIPVPEAYYQKTETFLVNAPVQHNLR